MSGYLALELRRAFRDRRYTALVIGWPVAAYLLFSGVFGASSDRSEGLAPHVEIMVAMATFGAMGAVLLATGPRMATDRQQGWLRQLSLTPLSATRILLVRVFAAIVLTLPAVALVFGAAATLRGVRLPWWEWTSMIGLLVIGCLPFAAIGVVIGGLSAGDGATGFTMVVYIMFAVLGGLWMPLKLLPATLRAVGGALPSHELAELGWRVAGGHGPPAAATLVLAVWLTLAAGAAVTVSRRVGSRAR